MKEYVTAVQALDRMLNSRHHLEDCFADSASPLSQQIAFGVVRHYFLLQQLTVHLLDKPLPVKHQDIQLLLLAGLYSIDHLNRPAHASVNACVSAVAGLGKQWARGLVNGVLRRYGRERDRLLAAANTDSEARLNHPAWLIKTISASYPSPEDILSVNNERAPMTLRVNRRRGSRDEYLAMLTQAGISADRGTLSESAVVLAEPVAVDALPGFRSGYASIQDEAPQLTPALMNLFPGASVLDACAAPGGKTGHLLEYGDDLRVTAIDRDRKRVGLISDNLERLSLQAEVICTDLESFDHQAPFDRILLDVPCSATGIIRRHPDIKLLRQHADIAKLASTQRVLLKKAFELLCHGGELLYSTCSILPQENDDIITEFLAETRAAESIPLSHAESVSGPHSPGLQFLPRTRSHDGFYYAAIRRTATGGKL